MQRGVYFDAWFPRQHCYHPSLPPRRLRMVDDLVDYRTTVLVWSALGGGSLSLPYLEQEAFGEVDARSRFYGFVNDSEFIAECHKHQISVFGIVFEAQGWEFPVELNDAEDSVLSLNELRGVGHRDWMGLREFSQDRYPKLWPPFEQYFPGGLVNSDGDPVTDLIEECAARDIHQVACHARWVECPDREHQCHYMDRNNPVWREYLKAVIRIQVDAGVDGIQLDEAELPMGAFQYGGCFCKDCMKGFRAYLQAQPAAERSPHLTGTALDTFHYGDWLLERGHDFQDGRESSPLFGDYYRYQCAAIKQHFHELAEYARKYGRDQGREVLVSGNFFNLDPTYLALADDVDLIITEMRNTTYRQPEWYRYVAAFAGDKDVVVVENPYGGVVPELVELLERGRGHDLLRLSLYEGAAFGANMTVPYGSWMGSTIEDSFYAPHDLAMEIQGFLADHEDLYHRRTHHRLAVVFSIESTRDLISRQDKSDNLHNARDESVQVPYRLVVSALADGSEPFDVVLFPDGVTAPDRVDADTLRGYDTVVLPDCTHLTRHQAEAVGAHLDRGGCAVVVGRFGDNLPPGLRDRLLQHDGVRRAAATDLAGLTPRGRQVRVDGGVGVNIARLADGSAAVHLVNYGYDAGTDRVRVLRDVELSRAAAVRSRDRFAAQPWQWDVQPGRAPRRRRARRDSSRARGLRGRRPDDGGDVVKIAVLTGPRQFEIHDAPVPTIRADEVLVRVRACGVCTSDFGAWEGAGDPAYPLRLGHEVSGTVVEAGADTEGLVTGDPVGVWVTSHGFAEYVAVRGDYCRPAGGVALDTVLAEPLACAANAVEAADVRLGDDVVVVGAGFMGNLVQQLVGLRGARQVIVADTRPDALERATSMGAHRVVDVTEESLADVVGDLTRGRGADITFECTGSQGALSTLGDVTRMSGKLVLVGFHQGADREIPLAMWNWMAFEIVNAHFREVATIMRGMTIGTRLLTSGALSLEPLVTHRFDMADIGLAFRTALDKPAGFAKATVVFDPVS